MARKRKFDFTGVTAYKRCEEGIHTAQLIQIDDKETQNGDDMLVCQFKVIKGDSEGAVVYDNLVLTDKALWKFKLVLESLGVAADGKVVVDLDKLIGKTCDIEVAHEEYNGQLRARILGYSKASVATADIEDDDEEEEEEVVEEKPKKTAKKKEEPKQEKPAKKEAPKKELNEDEDDDWEDDEDWEED